MSEKILTYEEAERKIANARGAKVVVRKECGVADIYDIFKEKYIGSVGEWWAWYIGNFNEFHKLNKRLKTHQIKSTEVLAIIEVEVI